MEGWSPVIEGDEGGVDGCVPCDNEKDEEEAAVDINGDGRVFVWLAEWRWCCRRLLPV
jgi:hypothetical protein